MIHVAPVGGELIKNVSAEASLFWAPLLWQGTPHRGWGGVKDGQWGGGKVLTSQEEVESFPASKARSSLTLDGPSGGAVAEEGRSKLFCVGGP